MSYRVVPRGLPGYEDYHTVEVTYSFDDSGGVQSPGIDPRPGRPFYAVGFPRSAFLPDTEKGRRVLALLKTAFERKMTFAVGPDDVLQWNIEHRTEFAGPTDLGYLDRVTSQLSDLGVAEEEEHDV